MTASSCKKSDGAWIQYSSPIVSVTLKLKNRCHGYDGNIHDAAGKKLGSMKSCFDCHPEHNQDVAVDPNGVPAISLRKALAGAVGIATAEMGIGVVDDDVAQKRQSVCESCPTHRYNFGRCNKCGCYLWAKIRKKGESCPDGHW